MIQNEEIDTRAIKNNTETQAKKAAKTIKTKNATILILTDGCSRKKEQMNKRRIKHTELKEDMQSEEMRENYGFKGEF